jgi:hypothetical protein
LIETLFSFILFHIITGADIFIGPAAGGPQIRDSSNPKILMGGTVYILVSSHFEDLLMPG